MCTRQTWVKFQFQCNKSGIYTKFHYYSRYSLYSMTVHCPTFSSATTWLPMANINNKTCCCAICAKDISILVILLLHLVNKMAITSFHCYHKIHDKFHCYYWEFCMGNKTGVVLDFKFHCACNYRIWLHLALFNYYFVFHLILQYLQYRDYCSFYSWP